MKLSELYALLLMVMCLVIAVYAIIYLVYTAIIETKEIIKKDCVREDENEGELISIIRNLEKTNDMKVVYLSIVGSKLFGTDTKDSDTDYRGIFIPSVNSCITKTCEDNIIFKTKNDDSKNNSEDLDVQLWSIQHFLSLLSFGDVNAIDLLFSYTKKDAVVINTKEFNKIIENRNILFNMKDAANYLGFSRQQAIKYGLKGRRYGKIKDVHNYVKSLNTKNDSKLKDVMFDIVNKFGEYPLCFIKKQKDYLNRENTFIEICGVMHQDTISIKEFLNRMEPKRDGYGERAKLAEVNEGEDYKALSHSIRCIYQVEMLFKTGKIIFPLLQADYLRDIKLGKISKEDINKEFNSKIDVLTHKAANMGDYPVNKGTINNFIMMFYKDIT
jgi:predicted nucleotidyltransferase